MGHLRPARVGPSERDPVHRPPVRHQAPDDHPQDGQAEAGKGPGFLTIRAFLPYADRRLHIPADPVGAVTETVRMIWDDMVDTMEAMPGVGLAAPQIGIMLRLAVVAMPLLLVQVQLSPHLYISGGFPSTTSKILMFR